MGKPNFDPRAVASEVRADWLAHLLFVKSKGGHVVDGELATAVRPNPGGPGRIPRNVSRESR